MSYAMQFQSYTVGAVTTSFSYWARWIFNRPPSDALRSTCAAVHGEAPRCELIFFTVRSLSLCEVCCCFSFLTSSRSLLPKIFHFSVSSTDFWQLLLCCFQRRTRNQETRRTRRLIWTTTGNDVTRFSVYFSFSFSRYPKSVSVKFRENIFPAFCLPFQTPPRSCPRFMMWLQPKRQEAQCRRESACTCWLSTQQNFADACCDFVFLAGINDFPSQLHGLSFFNLWGIAGAAGEAPTATGQSQPGQRDVGQFWGWPAASTTSGTRAGRSARVIAAAAAARPGIALAARPHILHAGCHVLSGLHLRAGASGADGNRSGPADFAYDRLAPRLGGCTRDAGFACHRAHWWVTGFGFFGSCSPWIEWSIDWLIDWLISILKT